MYLTAKQGAEEIPEISESGKLHDTLSQWKRFDEQCGRISTFWPTTRTCTNVGTVCLLHVSRIGREIRNSIEITSAHAS